MGVVGFPHNASWSATSRTNYHTPVSNLRVGVSTLVIAVSPWTANLCAAAPRIWLADGECSGLSKTVFAWSITVCRLTGGADFQHGMTPCPLQLRCQSWQRFTAKHAVKWSAVRAPRNKDPDWEERRSHTFGQHSLHILLEEVDELQQIKNTILRNYQHVPEELGHVASWWKQTCSSSQLIIWYIISWLTFSLPSILLRLCTFARRGNRLMSSLTFF